MAVKTRLSQIHELYKDSELENVPLLSDFSATFWQGYVSNFDKFDKMFARMYYSFNYYNPLLTDEDTISERRVQFTADVYSILLKNQKKYEELYRIHVIPDDDAYSITNNYDRHETYSGTNGMQSSAISGQRTDVSIDQIGEQNASGLNKVTGWNYSDENTDTSNDSTMGSREDTHQFTKGREEDTARSNGQDSHTSRIYGNIGVSTVDDMLKKHNDFWQLFDFYQTIFNDINKELLLVGRC